MAKKKEMTPAEQKLYNDLKKLAKRANQRLVRLERLTGEKGTFASKQLYDYLDSSTLNALTPSLRIKVSKTFNLMQLKAIIKYQLVHMIKFYLLFLNMIFLIFLFQTL